jgi:hypothetical protein
MNPDYPRCQGYRQLIFILIIPFSPIPVFCWLMSKFVCCYNGKNRNYSLKLETKMCWENSVETVLIRMNYSDAYKFIDTSTPKNTCFSMVAVCLWD